MAKVTIKSIRLDSLKKKRIRRLIYRSMVRDNTVSKFMDFYVSRVTSGFNPTDDSKYPGYSAAYKKAIRTQDLFKSFGKKIRPANNKLSGQLLKAIKIGTRFIVTKGEIVLKPKARRSKYPGVKAKNTPTNTKLVGFLDKQGRPSLGLGSKLKKKLRQLIVRAARKIKLN